MKRFSIGVLLDSFRLAPEEAMRRAAALGVKGVQVYATKGDLAPENMDAAKRRAFRALADDCGLTISALCGDLGRDFGCREQNGDLIERSKRILDLAQDLGTSIVTTHIGLIPLDETTERYQIMQEACSELARYADSMNAHFAIETGPDISLTLRQFLDGLHSTGVAVNFDPANIAMVTGEDLVTAVRTLAPYIVHTHAKDGVMLRYRGPAFVYGGEHPSGGGDEVAFREVPLGEGSVRWPEYLAALEGIGYHGFLTIEREVGENPEADIAKAVSFLDSIV
ncbi:MAG: sugar phosphate isomerase/epimerase [Clostridiales bacterium]|nr:sugar phosphate isomerase/epimerase [Clostridiales bacterium]